MEHPVVGVEVVPTSTSNTPDDFLQSIHPSVFVSLEDCKGMIPLS